MFIRIGVFLLLFLGTSFGQLLNRSGEDSTIFISHKVFLPRYPYGSAGEPWDLDIGDLDGDGDLDVAVAARIQNVIALHLNDGKGGFHKSRWINTCGRPTRVVIKDINLDNKKDLIFICSATNHLAWRTNYGGLQFAKLKSIKTGGFPTDLVVEDLNGDSYPDAVVVSNSEGKLYVHYWDKSLQIFKKPKIINTVFKPRSLHIVDIDEDGKKDLLVGSDDYKIAIHYHSSENFDEIQTLRAPDVVWDLTAADLDKDGDLDIAFVTYYRASVCIYKNAGVKFEGPTCIKSGEYNFGIVAGDLDKDGNIDLATASSRDNVVNVHLNKGNFQFVFGRFKSGDYNTGIAILDVDGDKDLDVITCSANDNSLNVHRNIPIDIAKEEKIKLYGYVSDTIANKKLKGVVEVLINTGSEWQPLTSKMSDANGYYELEVPYGRKYKLQARIPDYDLFGKEVTVKKKSAYSAAKQKQGIRVDLKTGKPVEAFIFGKIIDKETGQPLKAKITIQNRRLETVAEFYADEKGKYKKILPLDKGYRIIVEMPEYKKEIKTFDLLAKYYKTGLELNFALQREKAKKTCAEGTVYDKKTNKPLAEAVIDIKNEKGKIIETVKTDKNGKYSYCLEEGKYYVGVNKKGYFYVNDSIVLTREHAKTPLKADYYLEPLEKDKTFVLKNIYYDYDKATLRPESKAELDRLVRIMKENPTLVIEIGGHTDSDGSDAYNLRLSQARAQSVVDYLIRAGIPRSRMVAKGYGESQPVAPNDTPENKQKNRRTEFKILKY